MFLDIFRNFEGLDFEKLTKLGFIMCLNHIVYLAARIALRYIDKYLLSY